RHYRPEKDERHFLYRHYLELIRKYHPAAFVMENVKGILSSKVGGSLIFPQILRDLAEPGGRNGPRYRIVPLVVPSRDLEGDASRFILRAEELGVPQARHGGVLLGVNGDVRRSPYAPLVASPADAYVEQVLLHLPRLRSGMPTRKAEDWHAEAARILMGTARPARKTQAAIADVREGAV